MLPATRALRFLAPCTLAALALAAVGCGASAGGPEDTGSDESAVSANEKTAYDFFVGKGLKNFQAAGIVGNLQQESDVDPTILQYGGGPGRGIAQWSAGGRWDTDSHDNVVWYAKAHGASEWSLDLQLEFVWYELETFSSYGLQKLRDSQDVSEATVAFETDFEGCGQCDQSNRIAYAEAVLKAYGSSGGETGPKPAIPPEPTGCGRIEPGEGLGPGKTFESCDGRFTLAMQTDGNFVLYQGSKPLWATMTNGHGGYIAVMQNDGNLVVYDEHSHPLWASHTNGHDGSFAAVQDDGNFVVYTSTFKPIWASNTCCR